MIRLCVVFALCIFSGCSSSETLYLHSREASTSVTQFHQEESAALSAWSDVLRTVVNSEGAIDFHLLKDDPKLRNKLERFIGFLASYSPLTNPSFFDSKEAKLAFYINAYNAQAMYAVIRNDIPKDLEAFSDRLSFFVLTKFLLGGTKMSLHTLENSIIRPFEDPRVHFAITGMSVSSPRLLREPYDQEALSAQLDAATKEFLNSEKFVVVDEGSEMVKVSEILDFFLRDFVEEERARELIEYMNTYREKPISTDYKVTFLDYDWRVNTQAAAGSTEG